MGHTSRACWAMAERGWNKIPECDELEESEESRGAVAVSASADENLIVPPSPVVAAQEKEVASSRILSSPPLPSRQHVPDQHRPHQRQQTNQESHSRRILDRDGGFAQSRGRWSIGNASWLSDRSLLRQQQFPEQSRLASSGNGNHDSNNDDQGTSGGDDGNSDDWVEVSSTVSNEEDDDNQHQCCLSRLFCCLQRRRRRGRSSAISRLHASPFRRCWDNWYHSLAYTPTIYLMMILFLCSPAPSLYLL